MCNGCARFTPRQVSRSCAVPLPCFRFDRNMIVYIFSEKALSAGFFLGFGNFSSHQKQAVFPRRQEMSAAWLKAAVLPNVEGRAHSSPWRGSITHVLLPFHTHVAIYEHSQVVARTIENTPFIYGTMFHQKLRFKPRKKHAGQPAPPCAFSGGRKHDQVLHDNHLQNDLRPQSLGISGATHFPRFNGRNEFGYTAV